MIRLRTALTCPMMGRSWAFDSFLSVFSAKPYDYFFLEKANEEHQHELAFFETHPSLATVALANGFPAICVFVNDQLDAPVLQVLVLGGTIIVALRCAGFSNVDLKVALAHQILVVRVPAYSLHAIAEHTVALILTLNRQIHRAYSWVREGNSALDGLLGFDLHGLTVGIIGTGKIGFEVAKIMSGFGCQIVAYGLTLHPDSKQIGIQYVELDDIFARLLTFPNVVITGVVPF